MSKSVVVSDKKREAVAGLSSELSDSQGVVLVDFRGVSVKELTGLRRELAGSRSSFRVWKNSTVRFAFEGLGVPLPSSMIDGPTGVVISKDDFAKTSRVVAKFFDGREVGGVKAGLLQGSVLTRAMVNEISSLPGRDELLAKAVGLIKSPLSGLVGALSSPIRGLCLVLNQIADKKSGGAL